MVVEVLTIVQTGHLSPFLGQQRKETNEYCKTRSMAQEACDV